MLLDPLSRVSGNILPHILLPATQILALALPPFRHRATIFVPLIVGLVYATWSNLFMTATVGRAFLIAQWPWYMGTLAKLIFQEPEQLYWRDGHPPQEATTMGFWDKLGWSTMLYLSPRGVGWNYRVRNVRPGPKQTRGAFLRDALLWLAVCWIFLDGATLFLFHRYYHGDISLANLPTATPERGSLLGIRTPIAIFTTLSMVYFPTNSLYTQISIVCVALGSNPEHWPPAFGNNLDDLRSLRVLWNSLWHQFIRKTFRDWTTGVMGVLGVPHGTRASTYIQLYGAFFITALGHGIVTYAASAAPTATFADRFALFFNFMMLHAVAINLEDVAIATYRRVVGGKEGRWWHRPVGYLWTCGFWCYSAHMAMAACMRTGIVAESPVPFPIWGPILKALGYL